MKLKNYLLIAIIFFSFSNMFSQREPVKFRSLQQNLSPFDTLVKIPDSTYNWKWDAAKMNWRLDNKSVDFTHDANNNVTGFINKVYQNNSWVNKARYSDSFNSKNSPTNQTDYKWNGTGWDYVYQMNYTYDANNNVLTENGQSWTNGAWKNESLITYTYDSKNNKILEVSQVGVTTGWKNWCLVKPIRQ